MASDVASHLHPVPPPGDYRRRPGGGGAAAGAPSPHLAPTTWHLASCRRPADRGSSPPSRVTERGPTGGGVTGEVARVQSEVRRVKSEVRMVKAEVW